MLLPEPFAAPPSALALAPAPSPPSTSNPPSTSASTPSAEKEVEDLIPADEPTVVPSSHPTTIQADDPTVVSTDANADILPEPTIPQDPLPIVPSPTPNPNPSAHPDQPAPPPPAPTFKPSDLVGLQVYYPYDMGKFVPTAKLRLEKWTDASNKFDEEVGMDEMEWSDDEAEAEARKRRKLSFVFFFFFFLSFHLFIYFLGFALPPSKQPKFTSAFDQRVPSSILPLMFHRRIDVRRSIRRRDLYGARVRL